VTDERFAFIAEQITAKGWAYDAVSGQFVMDLNDERVRVDWQDVIALISGMSLGDLLDAYAERRNRTDT
jgi:hypothetical protein